MVAMVLDVETNGAEPPDVIEVFAASIAEDLSFQELVNRRFGTDTMTLRALSTHHITLDELDGLEKFKASDVPACDYLIGHNIDFDWEAIGKPNCKRICTLALSRHLWPELDCHTLTAMGYAKLSIPGWSSVLKRMHSAQADVSVVIGLLSYIQDAAGVKSWDALWELSEVARVPTVMTFGKHKGTPISEVPSDYIRWLLSQPNIDPYLEKALKARKR